MRVFNKGTINRLCSEHADAAQALLLWLQWAEDGAWSSPASLTQGRFAPSPIGPSRIVFDIRGKSYRLICDVAYQRGWVFLKWFGSHADYDRIDAATATNLTGGS